MRHHIDTKNKRGHNVLEYFEQHLQNNTIRRGFGHFKGWFIQMNETPYRMFVKDPAPKIEKFEFNNAKTESAKRFRNLIEKSNPDLFENLSSIATSGGMVFIDVVSVYKVNPHERDYKLWFEQAVSRDKSVFINHVNPLGFKDSDNVFDLKEGSCFKSSVQNQILRAIENSGSKKAKQNITCHLKWVSENFPDGPVRLLEGCQLLAKRFNVVVFNIFGRVVLKLKAERENKEIRRLTFIVHDGHICPAWHTKRATENVHAKTIEDFLAPEIDFPAAKAPEKIEWAPTKIKEVIPWKYVESLQELNSIEPGTYYTHDVIGALKNVVPFAVPFTLILQNGQVNQFMFHHVDNKKIVVKSMVECDEITEPRYSLEHEIDYKNAQDKLLKRLLCSTTRCEVNQDVFDVFDRLRKFGIKRCMGEGSSESLRDGIDGDFWECDASKHYTYILKSMEGMEIPVPCSSDHFYSVDMRVEDADDLAWYVVKLDKTQLFWFSEQVYYRKELSLCLGSVLKRMAKLFDREDERPTGLRPPIRIVGELKTAYTARIQGVAAVIDWLYKDALQDTTLKLKDVKKIVNMAIGMAGRSRTRAQRGVLFKDPMSAYKVIEDNPRLKLSGDPDLNIVYDEDRKVCLNGWKHSVWAVLQELAAENVATFMHKNLRYKPVAIKTDAVYFRERPNIKYDGKLGSYKLPERGKIKANPMDLSPPNLPEFKEKNKWITHEFTKEQEYDTELMTGQIHEILKSHNRLSIQAHYAGSGKTRLWVDYVKKYCQEKRIVVVCPNNKNKLDCQRYFEDDSIDVHFTTSHKWWELPVINRKATRNVPPDANMVILEEAFLFCTSALREMATEAVNRDYTLIMTGDIDQLKPVQDTRYSRDAVGMLMQSVFKNRVYLHENKTLPESQKPLLKELREMLVERKDKRACIQWFMTQKRLLSEDEALARDGLHLCPFKCIQSLGTNIAAPDTWTYRPSSGRSSGKFVRNAEYLMVSNDGSHVELQGQDGVIQKIKVDQFHKNFESSNMVTIHSCQGSRTSGNLYVHGVSTTFVGCEELYMAITRARDFDKVYLVQGISSVLLNLKAYIRDKVVGYTRQDRTRDQETTITSEDIWALLKADKFRCRHCGADFYQEGTWTLDRTDDDLGHTKENCGIACLACNRKGTKSP